MNMPVLKDHVALVSGAARGIGAVIAEKLASEGAMVVCADLLPCEETRDRIGASGGHAESRELDVSSHEAAAALVREIHASHGRLDILVNNAGITRDQLLIRMKPEDWALVLKINLEGAFNLSQPAAKIMMKQRSGRIINMASIIGLMGNAGQGNYAASKAGLIGLTKSLAKELGPRNITVNAVAPGLVDTDMAAALEPAAREALISTIPLGRIGTAEEVAAFQGVEYELVSILIVREDFNPSVAYHKHGTANVTLFAYNRA